MSGTTMSTSSWLDVTSTSPIGFHCPSNGTGNCVCSEPVRYEGSASVIASHSCATPMVATSTMTRGDLNKRRITASSTTTPLSVPRMRARISDGMYGQPCTPAMTAKRATAGMPMLPTAKLITRDER